MLSINMSDQSPHVLPRVVDWLALLGAMLLGFHKPVFIGKACHRDHFPLKLSVPRDSQKNGTESILF
jgi:hypothetical protein